VTVLESVAGFEDVYLTKNEQHGLAVCVVSWKIACYRATLVLTEVRLWWIMAGVWLVGGLA